MKEGRKEGKGRESLLLEEHDSGSDHGCHCHSLQPPPPLQSFIFSWGKCGTEVFLSRMSGRSISVSKVLIPSLLSTLLLTFSRIAN
jgi:hypothetical protein